MDVIVCILQLHYVEWLLATPVNDKALVGNAVWEKPIVGDRIVITGVVQDCLREEIIAPRVIKRIMALDRGLAACMKAIIRKIGLFHNNW